MLSLTMLKKVFDPCLGRNAQSFKYFYKLDQIQPALASLNLGDEGLCRIQPRRQFGLGYGCFLPCLLQQSEQELVVPMMRGCGHSLAPVDEPTKKAKDRFGIVQNRLC